MKVDVRATILGHSIHADLSQLLAVNEAVRELIRFAASKKDEGGREALFIYDEMRSREAKNLDICIKE